MSYGGYNSSYGQGGRGGNPYGQQGGNPYTQQDSNPYSQQGTNPYSQPGQYDTRYNAAAGGTTDVEMNTYGQAGATDPNAILNQCTEINRAIDVIERNLDAVRRLNQQSLNETDTSPNSPTNQERQRLTEDTQMLYRNLVTRVRNIKSQPESNMPMNEPQVGRVQRRLKTAIADFQNVDRDYRQHLQERSEREIRIVNPDITDAELREAVENGSNSQVFTQALLQGDRRGQSTRTLQHVKQRHEAIQKIERDIIELAQLSQELEAVVIQQEAAVVQVDQQGEQVKEDVSKGNQQMSTAINSARARNRKKWWCLLLVVVILIVIAVIVAVVVVVTRQNNN